MALLSALALTVGFVVDAAPDAAAQTAAFDLEVFPAIDGDRAIRASQTPLLGVRGSAPSGPITAAQLVAIEADGTQRIQNVSSEVLNRGPAGPLEPPRQYLQNTNGTIEGRLSPGCLFATPRDTCPHGPTRRAAIIITVGAQTSTLDQVNRVRVDYVSPVLRDYELVAPREILAVFSEPVRHPGGESALDWQVEDRRVLEVRGPTENDCVGRYLPDEDATAGPTGCTRRLVIDLPLDEDATPFIDYRAFTEIAPLRTTHVDYASNTTFLTAGSDALNRIRPPLPAIQSVDGKTPTSEQPRVVGNARTPAVRVGNLRAGHEIEFRVTRPSGSITESGWTTVSAEEQTFDLSPLATDPAGDGLYVLEAVVRDPHGNKSDDAHLAAARADGEPSVVHYELDTVPPTMAAATRVVDAPDELLVLLSEPVLPNGDRGRWTVNGEAATASGSGPTRTLRMAGSVPAGTLTVAWEPTSTSYGDAAGNQMLPAQVPVAALPVVLAPVVSIPAGERYTSGQSVTIAGSAEPRAHVEIYPRGGDTGDRRAVAEVGEDGSWSVAVSLPQDGRFQFDAVALDPTTGARSERTPAPDVIRDTQAPHVEVHAPTERPVLEDPLNPDRRRRVAVGDTVVIEWTAEDPAPGGSDHGTDPVRVQRRVAGDEGWQTIATEPYGNPGERRSYGYTVTEQDLGGLDQREMVFRVLLSDLAGNVGGEDELSSPVLLLSELVGFAAHFVAPASAPLGEARVVLRFPVAVEGTTTPLDWEVQDELSATANQVTRVSPLQEGGTRLDLWVSGITDPNATPAVVYSPVSLNPAPLRSHGRDVTQAPQVAADEVAPALSVSPPGSGPVNAASVTVGGSTDDTARPNSVRVFRGVGGQSGTQLVAVEQAAGSYQVEVPLVRDARNDFVVDVVDPAGNSADSDGFFVVEDSTAPQVTITSPQSTSDLPAVVPIRWTTVDAHPDVVRLDYRVDGGDWERFAEVEDTGSYDWDRPELPAGSVVEIRVTAVDRAGNAGSDVVGVGLPVLDVPVVSVPSVELFTADSSVQVGGSAPAGLDVEIYRTGGDQPVATVRSNGQWSVPVELDEDGRYRFEAQARDPQTKVASERVAVPDVVRDTRAPQVDVHAPERRPATEDPFNTDRRRRVFVGDTVTVDWSAHDPAPEDDELDDHGTSPVLVQRRVGAGDWVTVAERPYEPGADSFEYTFTEEDLAGADHREVVFRVVVEDLADNKGEALSSPLLLLAALVGFDAGFVQPAIASVSHATVVVRFPVAVDGATLPVEWRVDDELSSVPNVVSSAEVAQDGRTVTLRVSGITDPNATPAVVYSPVSLNPAPLRSDGRDVTQAPQVAADEVAPALSVSPPGSGPVNAASVTVGGSTDDTARPNSVRVFRGVGGQSGRQPVAVEQAAGSYQVEVPLVRDARNDFVVDVVDPAGNSAEASDGFFVVEDSAEPEVTITQPSNTINLPGQVPIRWSTVDAHPYAAELEYRVDGGDWHQISTTEDTGAYDWDRPQLPSGSSLEIRVTAIDRAWNRGYAVVGPDSGGPGGPGVPGIPGLRTIATGERTIEMHFSEPVVIQLAPAGLSVRQGPGVRSIDGEGTRWVLTLNADLETNRPWVVSNGTGIRDGDGVLLPSFRVQAERGFAFAVQGLGGAATSPDAIRLSWVDERNVPSEVVRYEVRRDGDLVAQLPREARGYFDATAGRTERTYEVVTVDDLGHRSRPATTTIDPLAPNITPQGGFVLSEDGLVALIVPPGAVDRDHFGTLSSRQQGTTPGFRPVMGGYALRAEAAGDRTPLEQFQRYSCLSFRPGEPGLAQAEQARLMGQRLLGTERSVELSTWAGRESASSCILTLGDFTLAEAEGISTRVYGPDPAIAGDRFATAAGLSQTSFVEAGEAIIARADDFPDALASAALAEQVGGPILLSTPEQMPPATVLELQRLGVQRVTLVGGRAALGASVAEQARALGIEVRRVSGATRFDTAVAVAKLVGTVDGSAYLATGENFADALAASSSSAYLGRPVFLVGKDLLPEQTLAGLREVGVQRLDVLGGGNAIASAVEEGVRDAGMETRRIFGSDRYQTALELATLLQSEGMEMTRPVAASGQGVGKTSPDALASGPIAARSGSPLLLLARDFLHDAVGAAVGSAPTLRGVAIAGGSHAITDETRAQLNAAR